MVRLGFVGVQAQANLGLFSAIGGLVRKAAGVLTGGVSEVAIGAVQQFVSRPSPQQFVTPAPQLQLPPGFRVQAPVPGFTGAVQRFLPGGSTGFQTIPQSLLPVGTGAPSGVSEAELQRLAQGAGQAVGMLAECPKGFRRNRTTYFLKSGELVTARSRCVRIRRTNPDNGRASTRAARRLLTRKKHQDRIDKALESISPRRRTRTKAAPSGKPQIIVAGN